MLHLDPFVASQNVGYSCQTVLGARINRFLYGTFYYCWFATRLNPIESGDSSNPLWLYMTLDRAVKKDDSNHAKVRDTRANLMWAAKQQLKAQGRNHEVRSVIKRISMADLELFRPQLWKLNLAVIDSNRYAGKYQYSDEAVIKDLKSSEFEVIVE